MKNWSFISLRKFRKLQHLLRFFGFQWPKNRLKMVLASPNDRKCQSYPLVLKLNVTLARTLRLVILYLFKWKILSDDRRLYLHDSKWNSGSDVDGLTHTKQLLNLLCIVYSYMGQFMRFWYLSHAKKKDVDEGSGQILWDSSWHFVCIAYASSEGSDEPAHLYSTTTAFAACTEKMKRCRWRYRPNSVPSKTMVLMLLIHF